MSNLILNNSINMSPFHPELRVLFLVIHVYFCYYYRLFFLV